MMRMRRRALPPIPCPLSAMGESQREREAPLHQVVCDSPSTIDPLWQTTNWLKSFQEQCEEDEPMWWPLIHPLTDGDDAAVLALARRLMAVWRLAITISTSPICLPASMVMNIGQFFNADTTRCGWSMKQWLEAYAHGLQCPGEAAEGRCWWPVGESFAPKVSPLVEAFIGMTGVWDVEDCAVASWSEPLGEVPHQRDEGAYADIRLQVLQSQPQSQRKRSLKAQLQRSLTLQSQEVAKQTSNFKTLFYMVGLCLWLN